MTMAGFTATAQTDVAATPGRVWAALTEPEQIAAYMQGSQVTTTWQIGSPITWDGEYNGRSYQDKGEVLTYDEPHVLSVTHYSPMMGQPDEPQSYHTLVYPSPPRARAPTSSSPRTAATPRSRPRSSATTRRACWTGSRHTSRVEPPLVEPRSADQWWVG